jgi:hypothetical protein
MKLRCGFGRLMAYWNKYLTISYIICLACVLADVVGVNIYIWQPIYIIGLLPTTVNIIQTYRRDWFYQNVTRWVND